MAPAANHRPPDPSPDRPAAKTGPEEVDLSGSSPERTDGLEDLVDLWWSLYCPSCDSRYRHSATHCPKDGTELRHLSIVTGGSVTGGGQITGEFLSTGDFLPRCPECGNVFGLGEETCPHDGTPLTWLGEPVQEPELPRVIGEKWRLERRVSASTTFGIFYRGVHDILGMEVGIKILKPTFTATEKGRRLFHNEAMRVSLLNHPNVVKVFDYGEDGDTPFLVMEYLKGRPLYHYLRDGELALEDRVDVMCQVAEALIYAHSDAENREPLVHLDLKPEHIFLERVGDHWHVKVIDFGIAEIVAPRPSDSAGDSERGRVAGTPPYMGPERYKGVVDPRSDLYSLGVILYELVAGRRPFDANDPEVLRELHETVVPTPPSRHGLHRPTETDKKLDAIVLKTLEKKLEDRPESARALLKSLEEWKEERARDKEERERSTGEKVLRVAQRVSLGLLIAVVIVLPVLYWAPWVQFGLTQKELVLVVGKNPPDTPRHVADLKGAFGYQGGKLFLVTGARELELEWTMNTHGEVRIHLPSQQELQEIGLGEQPGQYRVRLRVVGSLLQRSRESDPFEFRVNYGEPVLKVTPGRLRDNVICLPQEAADRFVVRSDEEELDAQRSHFGYPGETEPVYRDDDRHSLEFELPRGQQQHDLRLTVTTAIGNEARLRIERVRKPEIGFKPSSIRTSMNPYPLSIPVAGRVERAVVSIDGNDHEFSEAETLEVNVGFKGKKGAKKVSVFVWSPLSEENPAARKVIIIEFRERDLRLEQKEGTENTFQVLDEDGETLPGDEIAIVAVNDANGNRVDFEPDQSTGELKPSEEGVRGKFVAYLRARDRYENRGAVQKFEFPYPRKPRIKGLELETPLGTEQFPFHPLDCECQRPATLSLAVEVDYSEPRWLAWQLLKEGNSVVAHGDSTMLVNGKLSIPLDELIRRLDQKQFRQPLELRVFDAGAPVLSDRFPYDLYFVAPWTYVSPEEAMRNRETNWVEVTTFAAKVKRVRIAGEWADKDPKRPNVFRREVRVARTSETPVDIEVHFDDGRVHRSQKRYWRAPIEGERYRFSIPGSGTPLTLIFGTMDGRGFWYTPFFRPRTLKKAEKARDDIQKSLAELVRQDTENETHSPRVALPTRKEYRSIWSWNDLKVGKHRQVYAWLSRKDEDNQVPRWDGAYVRIDSTGVSAREGARADDPNDEFRYRLIIEYQENGWLVPRNAESREDGELKDDSDSTQ